MHEGSALHHEFSARQFCFSRRFHDALLERQYRDAKFKLGRPRITALILLLHLLEIEVMVFAIVNGRPGNRVGWFSCVAPSVLLWLLLAILHSPWMSSSFTVAGNVGCLVSDRVILSGPSHPERAQDISRA